ncbi:hypothetical protein CONPUDRAFT_151771 [Coniophora puteana RWD-64-598 SS2]|uniref:Ribonuclease H1 N-terminal domain-containing protein n=1 Tax=Coniophora puteana (strain RWD-64-598) TaxID=741705 RepID=A0A5M3MVH1_CONPW|nr:uncharacterized protein CONPUDRAFT_151771 [Coniophora puteana RWD-64-598 SS2]EIW82714.1 hypothetical protein CONPUDRAFT_151771 [Coniophora puteana RWD-64-598 SS2]
MVVVRHPSRVSTASVMTLADTSSVISLDSDSDISPPPSPPPTPPPPPPPAAHGTPTVVRTRTKTTTTTTTPTRTRTTRTSKESVTWYNAHPPTPSTPTKGMLNTTTPTPSPVKTPSRAHKHEQHASPRQTPFVNKGKASVGRIPHPNDLKPPPPGHPVKKYYIVFSGQEVGLFYTWADAKARLKNVKDPSCESYKTFAEAVFQYRTHWEDGLLEACPQPGGPFWPRSPSPVASVSSADPYWLGTNDITHQLRFLAMQDSDGAGPSRPH